MPTIRSDDADISYDVTGDGDPLLLIMGLGTDARAWVRQLPAFAERYRVITLDNRGVGRSSTPPGPYTTEQMALDALRVLDDAGVERAHVVAVSMGGAIAQQLAVKAPERVRALVLGCTWAGPSEWRSRLRQMQLSVLAGGRDALVRTRILLAFSPPLFNETPRLAAAIERNMLAEQASLDGYLAHLDAAETHDLRARLPEIVAPTLVMVGGRDILVPPELSREVASLIPGARFELLESAHAIWFEEAERFNALTLAFLAEHER